MLNKVLIRVSALLCHLEGRKGQTLVEYALIIAFVSVLAIVVLGALGSHRGVFLTIISALVAARSGF